MITIAEMYMCLLFASNFLEENSRWELGEKIIKAIV